MTPDELDELERLEKAATKGPWTKRYADRVVLEGDYDGSLSVAHFYHEDGMACESNAALVASLRNAFPALLQLARIGAAAVEYYEALIRGTDPNIIQVMKLEQDRRCIDYLASRKGEK